MDIAKVKADLDEFGWAVVPGILTETECNEYSSSYRSWIAGLLPNGRWPYSMKSIIQSYRIGHLEQTWKIRVKSKPVFEALWGTEKLLSSIDGVSIGRPPEDGITRFDNPGSHWLHTDQSEQKTGLHGYQGGVNLEEVLEDDWCLQVLEGSHKFHSEFYQRFPETVKLSNASDFCRLRETEMVDWFKEKGCQVKRVPCPKGGIVLWDSRTIHANAYAKEGRRSPNRWRYTVFVTMTPAIWSTVSDMEIKKRAYENMEMTSHWPSQGVSTFPDRNDYKSGEIRTILVLPEIAKTEEVRKLCGVIEYDFKDGQSNGESFAPKWKSDNGRWCCIV
ncbi:unnamed protein product [Owenia fusiformis]|uniref:Uncharacterized protein n=1 Tax=Owenia fusiformis TaxID=6347 RepID=A0A8J1TTM1_OWEFU|nr:unnamed protein product [Owenia fusiformis]